MLSHWHKEEIILIFFSYTLWDAYRYSTGDVYAWGRYFDYQTVNTMLLTL